MKISIIIPVLNEACFIEKSLLKLSSFRDKGHEVIVVDGGSTDGTLEQATSLADKILQSSPGRARQMNTGADQASGDILIFLHADTYFDADVSTVVKSISGKHDMWGRFDIRLSGELFIYRIIEFFINTRSRLTRVATGDQAIFVSRNLFHEIGKFPDIELMEDVAFSKIMKKYKQPVCLKDKVISSSRRWEEKGIFKTILKMWVLRFKYYIGVPASRLARDYE